MAGTRLREPMPNRRNSDARMSSAPIFPPAYAVVEVMPPADPFESGLRHAAAGAEDGTLLWRPAPDSVSLALVLRPEMPRDADPALALVALVALGDTLGALLPPAMPVQFVWPDRVLVNGGVVGGARVALAPAAAGTLPDWLVLGAGVRLAPETDVEPGRRPERTCLQDEGGGDLAAPEIAESFARHFLAWFGRWQEAGLAPIREVWQRRAFLDQGRMTVPLAGKTVRGEVAGLDSDGSLRLKRRDGVRRLDLALALQHPSWRV